MNSTGNKTMAVDFGRPVWIVRLFRQNLALRFDLRTLGVSLTLISLAVAIALLALATGDYRTALADVISALFGLEDGSVHMVVIEWRLPRIVLALVFGVALGASGAIFQSLTRNPLGSPDIIGFSAGSYTGALVVITLLHGGTYAVACGALIGGLLTAVIVYLLAYGRGGVKGFRLILVGIGMSAMLTSLNTLLLLRAKLEVAMTAAVWGAGSLSIPEFGELGFAAFIVISLLLCALSLQPAMQKLEMGDDAARALGVNTERTKLALMGIGVALIAAVSAIAGPIGFIALAAPQLARRLTKTAGVAIVPAAIMGALMLVAADYTAQHGFASTQMPAGIVTISLGGIYFVWLLLREVDRR
jgi:iron complex transport system permease protein